MRLAFLLLLACIMGTPPARGQTAMERYQECFEKMIDAGEADNAYMRKCLGLEEHPALAGRSGGEPPPYLTKAEIGAVVDKRLPGLRECYDKLLVSSKELGMTPEGPLEVSFLVKPNGAPATVEFAPTTLADVGLLSCTRSWLLSLVFPKTSASESLTVRYAFRLSVKPPREAVVAVARSYPKISGPSLGFGPREMLAVFRKNAHTLRQCHDELARRRPNVGGQAETQLIVAPNGRVSEVIFKEFTVPDEPFRRCLTEKLRMWRFPARREREPAMVSYPPFVFKG